MADPTSSSCPSHPPVPTLEHLFSYAFDWSIPLVLFKLIVLLIELISRHDAGGCGKICLINGAALGFPLFFLFFVARFRKSS